MSDSNEQSLVPTDLGAELLQLVDASGSVALSDEERLLLVTLLDQSDRIDVVIPEDTPAERLWETALMCSRVLSVVRRAGNILKFLIGRALVLIQKNPELYERNGFRSLDAFLSDEVNGLPALLGISRGELYKAKSVAESNPTMSMQEYREIGFSKLGLLAGKVQEGDSQYPYWMEQARTSTFKELQTKIYASNMQIPEGSLEADVFTLPCTADQKQELDEFIADPVIQSAAGTKSKAQVLVNATREAQSTWAGEAENGEGNG